jgi:hypothetical protein
VVRRRPQRLDHLPRRRVRKRHPLRFRAGRPFPSPFPGL